MDEKIVLITGANSGIGKAASLKFAEEGFTVIMACRSLERSKIVQREIIIASNNERVELMELDMSSLASIREFCEAFKRKYPRLDILIHNAAYIDHGAPHRLSVDGMEMTFATNVVGPYLMTSLLIDSLKASDDARILHASSNIIKHFFDMKRKIDFENLIGEYKASEKFTVYNMYCQSKMAFLMLAFKFAEELKKDEIKVYSLQINGAKMSKETIKKFTFKYRAIATVQNLFFPPTSYMANNYYEICTAARFKDTTGVHLNDKLGIMEPAPEGPIGFFQEIKQAVGTSTFPAYAVNREEMEKVWAFCMRVTEEKVVAGL